MPQRVPSPSPYAPTIGFSAAVRAGDWVIVAGTTAVSPDGDILGGDDPYAQAVEALRKITAALAEAGATPADVVQTRIYLTRAEHWEPVGRAHGEVFTAPAATMIITGLLDPRMLVEIEAVAHLG
jgi:enamine deaminase RidA (YjgF/YER057c/UK114 family)